MNHELAAAMRRATDLVRAGDPAGATKLIQSSLGATGAANPGTTLPVAQRLPAPSGLRSRSKGRGLRSTLADLAARMPKVNPNVQDAPMPPLPDGARFEPGTAICDAGARDYRVYIPALGGAEPAGLVMMLHGCTQSPVDFANGTGMNRLGEEHGLIIVYPAQSRGANMQSCWNWFETADQARAAGEPAILARMAEELRDTHGVPHDRVFVAGLSAGAAMAVILGRTYPDVFAAVGAHSGLPYGSAHDVPSAFAAMAGRGPVSGSRAEEHVPTIVFHGEADATVSPVNGERIAEAGRRPGSEVLDSGTRGGRRYTRTTVISESGATASDFWRIEGLGHAWSGGSPAGSYTDPKGPDASAEMVRFFLDRQRKGD